MLRTSDLDEHISLNGRGNLGARTVFWDIRLNVNPPPIFDLNIKVRNLSILNVSMQTKNQK